jgi:hypothetical protein
MVFIMQCGNCRRYMIMEDEWCGSDMECPLCGGAIHLDAVAPPAPGAQPAAPQPPPVVQARPTPPRQ